MNLPGFSAHSSLYRSTRYYTASSSEISDWSYGETIVPAYHPGTGTQRECSGCLEGVAKALILCDGAAAVTAAVVCGTTGWITFGISCAGAAAALAAALGTCNVASLGGIAVCAATTCCPKLCGTPNPFDPGSGCCDDGEGCVDENDPNSRHGCCPSSQSVCAGKCCAVDESCCGSTCCPSPNHCCGDQCCPPGVPCCGGTCCSFLPPSVPPPPPPQHSCGAGGVPCGFPDASGVIRTCCPPGLQCCSYSPQFGPDCKTSCLH